MIVNLSKDRVRNVRARIGARARALALVLLAAGTNAMPLRAQAPVATRREFYMSWGYNGEGYLPTDMHLVQANGNDFTLHRIEGHEDRGWNKFWQSAPTVPQYSVRFGYFMPRSHGVAVEVSFEHARFIVTQGQSVRLTGRVSGQDYDTTLVVTPDVIAFKMNNGANFLLFNLVKRVILHGVPAHTGHLALLGKAGVGLLLPHADNIVLGKANTPRFQFGGFDTGVEVALRAHVFRRLYAEFGEKGVFARYRGVRIDNGHADLDLWAHTTAVSAGWSFF